MQKTEIPGASRGYGHASEIAGTALDEGIEMMMTDGMMGKMMWHVGLIWPLIENVHTSKMPEASGLWERIRRLF